jgi:hypothetical protein
MWITFSLQVEELALIDKVKTYEGWKKKYIHEIKEKPQLAALVDHFVPLV